MAEQYQAKSIQIRSADGNRRAWMAEAPEPLGRDGELGEHLDTGQKLVYWDGKWRKQRSEPLRYGYRADIGVAAVSGFAAELIPVQGYKLIVHGVFLSKPTAIITARLIHNKTASSGGTSTDAAIVPLGNRPSRGAQVKLFTAAPTAGIAWGDLAEHVLDTTDWMYFPFGQDKEPALELWSASETLAVNVNATATITGYISWSEEELT